MTDQSKVHRCHDFDWEGVPRREYKDDTSIFRDVHRYTLLGGDAEDEQALNFQTRYFEVEPGGYTSFEHHEHPHCVVVLRGGGKVILGDEIHSLGKHDVVYVSPDTPHQFKAEADAPLGFLCIVDRDRDRPVIPDDEELGQLIGSEQIKKEINR